MSGVTYPPEMLPTPDEGDEVEVVAVLYAGGPMIPLATVRLYQKQNVHFVSADEFERLQKRDA
jgi:hypothetical protein